MIWCSLWFRVVDDLFSLVLWETWVCLCLFLFLMFWDLAGVDGCIGEMEKAHSAAFDGPEAELCEADVVVTGSDTWEWCGVKVPVIKDTWDANVLAVDVELLLKISSDGLDVGLILCEPKQEIGLLLWINQFEALHSFISFDRTPYTMKRTSIGMFVWAVRWCFISVSKLCENLRRFHGSLLYQAVNLCHGFGLVDEDVAGFVRCVFCAVGCWLLCADINCCFAEIL